MAHCCTTPARRRAPGFLAKLIPAALALAIPRCPLCVAGWAAVLSGLGVGAATYSLVRMPLVIALVALSALLLAMPRVLRLARARIGSRRL